MTLALVAQFQKDQLQAAATELFRRYSERVLGFLKPRLSERLASRIEPDDVSQSVFNSFFRGVKEGDFIFSQREDVWKLLVTIALCKLRNQCRRHTTAGRNVGIESHDLVEAAMAREPTPAEAAAVGDELESCLRTRTPRDRKIVEQYIQGASHEAIAVEVKWSQRTVRRVCEQFLSDLQRRLALETNPIGVEDR